MRENEAVSQTEKQQEAFCRMTLVFSLNHFRGKCEQLLKDVIFLFCTFQVSLNVVTLVNVVIAN